MSAPPESSADATAAARPAPSLDPRKNNCTALERSRDRLWAGTMVVEAAAAAVTEASLPELLDWILGRIRASDLPL